MRINKSTFEFLRNLALNNNREWFNANKPYYEQAKKNTLEFVQAICDSLPGIDPELSNLKAEKALMRIYRDIRFSQDKTPYKTHFAAGLSSNGKMANEPGYYISISPDIRGDSNDRSCLFAAGYWMPSAENLNKIRQEIDYNFSELNKILEKNSFKVLFPSLSSEAKLKKAPKNYSPDHPNIDFLKHKSFVVTASLSENDLGSAKAIETVLNYIRQASPFISYLREACRHEG